MVMKKQDNSLVIRKKKWHTRSRSGCQTCRQRKVKCDEQKPYCSQCLIAGRKCTFGYVGSKTRLPEGCFTEPSSGGDKDRIVSITVPLPLAGRPQLTGSQDVCDLLYLVPRLTSTLSVTLDTPQQYIRGVTASYMSHLPCRSGYSEALDDAISCVAAAIRDFCVHFEMEDKTNRFLGSLKTRTLLLYTVALRSLQQALSDPSQSMSTEVLCAAHLLCCFESLRNDNRTAFQKHLNGVTKIIQHRRAESFTTDFDVRLLQGHAPLIRAESFGRNEPCFIHQDDWASVMHPSATGVAQSQMRLVFNKHMGRVFELKVKCTNLILKQGKTNKRRTRALHASIVNQLHTTRAELLEWTGTWVTDIFAPNLEDRRSPSEKTKEKGQWNADFFGICQALILVCNRLYTAVDCDNAMQVEKQTLQLSKDTQRRFKEHADDPVYPRPMLLSLAHRAILSTSEDWGAFCAGQPASGLPDEGQRRLISATIFRSWMTLLGVTVQE